MIHYHSDQSIKLYINIISIFYPTVTEAKGELYARE